MLPPFLFHRGGERGEKMEQEFKTGQTAAGEKRGATERRKGKNRRADEKKSVVENFSCRPDGGIV